MKSWVIIDDCTHSKAAMYEKVLKVETAQEALEAARREWNALSTSDKLKRDAFFVALAEIDEDGSVDFNSMSEITDIK